MGWLNSVDRCWDCSSLNIDDKKYGNYYYCMSWHEYVKGDDRACKRFKSRYLVTATCNILNIDLEQRKKLFKSFDIVRNEKTPESEYMYDCLEQYEIVGPIIADKLYKDNFREVIAESMYYDYIIPCHELIKEGKYLEAADKYIEMTYTLVDFYMSENKKNVRVR